MTSRPRPPLRKAIVPAVAALVAAFGLVVLWHALGLTSSPRSASYPLSQFIRAAFDLPFAVAFALVMFGLGWWFSRAWPVAVGAVAPLPIAAFVEMLQDPTSHNLIPFEVLLIWCPALLVSLAAAFSGLRLRQARA